MKEADIHRAVIEHWKVFGYPGTVVATIPNMGAMGQYGLTRGLFDLVVLGGEYLRDRTGWLELKSDKGRLSEHQKAFRDACISSGVPYAVSFGRDEPIRVLEEWKIVRRSA